MQRNPPSATSSGHESQGKEENKVLSSSIKNGLNRETSNPQKSSYIPLIEYSREMKFTLRRTLQPLKIIQRLGQRLTKLDYQIIYNGHQASKIYATQYKSLRDLRWLQSISLHFISYQHNSADPEFSTLCDTLRSLTQLRNIDIEFGAKTCFEDQEISYLSKSLRFLPRLESIKISLIHCEAIDQGLRQLAKSFRQLNLLKSITISFSRYKGQEAIVYLCDSLRYNTLLHTLNLWFCDRNITDGALISLSSSLKHMSVLQNLSLKCQDCHHITNKAIKSFCQSLEDQTLLQHLSLTFINWEKISNEGVEGLAKALGNLVFLKTLFLDFGFCAKMTDVGMRSLSINLACLTLLQKISFRFDYSGLTDEGIRFLAVSLTRLTGLQTVELEFSNSRTITDKTIVVLNETFRHLTSLQCLRITYKGCGITDKGVNSIKDGLKGLTKLQKFYFLSDYCGKVTPAGKESLKTMLQDLKQIKNIEIY